MPHVSTSDTPQPSLPAMPPEAVATARTLTLPMPLTAVTRSAVSRPLVSCLLVVDDSAKLRLARQAIRAFTAQSYPRKQLVVVNATGLPSILEAPLPGAVETHCDPSLSRGAKRNAGLDVATGAWLTSWGEEEHAHPDRLAYLMSQRQEGMPCLLGRQIRVNLKSSVAFYHEEPTGIPGTALFPRTEVRYPDVSLGEDLLFLLDAWGRDRVVVDNRNGFPAAALSVAFYHGRHLTPEEWWMGKTAAGPRECRLNGEDAAYLRHVLAGYGVTARFFRKRQEASVPENTPAGAHDPGRSQSS